MVPPRSPVKCPAVYCNHAASHAASQSSAPPIPMPFHTVPTPAGYPIAQYLSAAHADPYAIPYLYSDPRKTYAVKACSYALRALRLVPLPNPSPSRP